MTKSEEGRKLDLFLLKQCAVLLHEVVQSLHYYKVDCPFCGSGNLSQRAKKKDEKRKGIVVHCKDCEHQFVVADHARLVEKIVDVILLMGDAGIPLPPKRDT